MLEWVRGVTGARAARRGARLQSLWSGYGELVRVHLEGGPAPTVVVKEVTPPERAGHPRGWATDRSHARKLRSYEVEQRFYATWAPRCDDRCRVPTAYGLERAGTGWRFALEDLDAAGFPERRGPMSDRDVESCLAWLAAFHATFLGVSPEGLWDEGTYWHLATRPDELAAMAPGPLRDAAPALDAALRGAAHRTLVHGDAKVANFCFGPAGVAAVDFQYVGGGVGVKDVAYLLSCLDERRCERDGARLLDVYFGRLRRRLEERGLDPEPVEAEWRALHPVAVADFERFLAGWAPDHRKRTGYAAALTREALERVA